MIKTEDIFKFNKVIYAIVYVAAFIVVCLDLFVWRPL